MRHRAKNPIIEQHMDSLRKQIYQLRRARLGNVDTDPEFPKVEHSDLA